MENGIEDVDKSLRLTEEASSDNSGLHNIVEQMFEIIQQIDASGQKYGSTVRSVASSSTNMKHSIGELQTSTMMVRNTANKLHQLVGQFQVSQG